MSEPKNKIVFSVKKGDKDVELAVVRPTLRAQQDAQMVYAKGFADFVRAGALLKTQLDATVRERKLWDDARQAEFVTIQTRLEENKQVVKGKVKGATLEKAKAAAIEMRRDRVKLRNLTADRVALDANTAEGQADNRRFACLVAASTVYADTNKPYFASLDDMLGREDDPAVLAAQSHFASLYYGYDADDEKSLPENQFLVKYRLCNRDLHLVKVVNGEERLVDTEGRLVDKDGRFVNEAGEFVDSTGVRVDEAGETVSETFPFVDEAGAEIPEPAAG